MCKGRVRVSRKEKVRSSLSLALSLATFLLLPLSLVGESNLVRNGGFNRRGAAFTFTQERLDKLRADGWICPDLKNWATWWGGYGRNGSVKFPRTGGVNADGYARLSGKDAFLTGYHDHNLKDCNYIYTVWARGKGVLRLHIISYGRDEKGKTRQITKPREALVGRTFRVNSDRWVRYRHLLVKTPVVFNIHPWIRANEGTLDIDEVDIVPSTPALDLIVEEEERLYGTGALVENTDLAQADETFIKKRAEYESALKDFHSRSAGLDKELVESLKKEMAALNPYIFTKGLTVVQVPYYNEMIAMTRVLKRLAGKPLEEATPVKAKPVNMAIDYKPGVRKARANTVTITEIKPNLILYEENAPASIKATIVSKAATAQKGTLIALMHLDLNTVREIKRESVTIAPGATKIWRFNYNVGPETYGRGIEVRFVDERGKIIDSWQEFYQVGKEWLRLQMHTSSRYNNMKHYFASEPTDFGVHSTDVEIYRSAQPGYRVSPEGRKRQITYYKQSRGLKYTFYQNNSFSGIMGYEEMRKHPEYVLYDENGQFAVDPVYGGYPNPMELASPIEIGPKRKAKKPYLDRMYTPWQHCPSNLARLEVVEYEAKCIKKYAKEHGFDGVFFDGSPRVMRGYGYDGKPNIPADKKQIAHLNALVAKTYQEILKEGDPYFGTWFNFSYHSVLWRRSRGWIEGTLGAGVDVGGVDVSDEWIRALAGWKNVSCLMEVGRMSPA